MQVGDIMSKYECGKIVTGCVTGVENYGIFVSLDEYYSGLIHISEISTKFVKDINDYVNIGETIRVKIVEKDEERAKELSASLPKARVILADATEQEVLDEENLKGCDACVTLTGMDEQNLIVSLYAKQSGVEKVVSKVDRQSVLNMVKMLGLDTVVTPKSVIANQIIRFVRASQTASGDGINNLYKLHDKVEALEFTVSEKFPALNKKLKEIGIKKNVLVGGIVRGDEFILPSGETEFVTGDKVIVVTAISKIAELVQILN